MIKAILLALAIALTFDAITTDEVRGGENHPHVHETIEE